VHTGAGVPFSLPSSVLLRAQEYPDVKIILAHAGGMGGSVFTPDYITAAKLSKNIYLEPSWSSIQEKRIFIREFGERVMLGSDLPGNTGSEIYQFRQLEKEGLTIDKAMGESAIRLFRL